MFKKIKFSSENKYANFPVTGNRVLPEWYRKHPSRVGSSNLALDRDNRATATFKKCMPMLDSFTTGFFILLETDIQVTQVNQNALLQWPSEIDPASLRDGTHTSKDSVPAGYSEKAWVWFSDILIKVPKGYSILITHPMNRFDLPFLTMSAIVDADTVMHQGKIPFYLKEGYEGVIKKGTPIFQVIPFKRESWQSEKDDSLIEQSKANKYKIRTYLEGWYKKNIWYKKIFRDGINAKN